MGSSKKKKNEAFVVATAFGDVEGVSKLLQCVNCEDTDLDCIICDGTGSVSFELAQELAADNDCSIQEEWINGLFKAYPKGFTHSLLTKGELSVNSTISFNEDGKSYAWELVEKKLDKEDVIASGVIDGASDGYFIMQGVINASKCETCGQFMSISVTHICPPGTETVLEVKAHLANIDDWAATFLQASQLGEVSTEEVMKYYAGISEETLLAISKMNAEPTTDTLTVDQLEDLRKELVISNVSALSMLNSEQLAGVAQSQGVAGAVLLSPESLGFYLNQAYYYHEDDEPPTKESWGPSVKQLKIKLAGEQRLQTAKNDGIYDGQTKAEIQNSIDVLTAAGYELPSGTTEALTAPLPEGAWIATKEEIDSLTFEASKALGRDDNNWNYWNLKHSVTLEQEMEALALHQKITTAHVDPSLSESDINTFKYTRDQSLQRLNQLFTYSTNEKELGDYLANKLGVQPEDREYLTTEMFLVSEAYDHSFSVHNSLDKQKEWKKFIEEKQEALKPYLSKSTYSYFGAANIDLSSIDQGDPNRAAKIATVFKDIQIINATDTYYYGEQSSYLPNNTEQPDRGSAIYQKVSQNSLTTGQSAIEDARAWAKKEEVSTLRDIATEMGLTNADIATRNQITGYITAHISVKNKSVADWQESVTASASKKIAASEGKGAQKAAAAQIKAQIKSGEITAEQAAVVQGLTAPPGSSLPNELFVAASKAKMASGKTNMNPPVSGSFSETIALTKNFAMHTKASLSSIPERLLVETIESSSFTDTPNPGLGGMHAKSFYKDSEGTTWMMKPYASAQGGSTSRAAAESAASSAMRAGGIPTVPVYHATINGQRGAFQPLIKNKGTLDASPSNYSQADVDSIVRMHVGTWLVGDHDLHASNVIRTEDGGLVPIDQGQAFKNFGRDELALNYHPNKKYGETPPIWQDLYRSAQTGDLSENVRVRPEVALGAISRYEAIPDNEWREMLSPVAKSGAESNDTYWRGPIAKAAAKKLGKTESSVSNEEIADEFLNQAVQRKRNLRGDFLSFFVTEGWTQAKVAFTVG